jgi:hypothetical protein
MERNGSGLIWGSVLAFAWRHFSNQDLLVMGSKPNCFFYRLYPCRAPVKISLSVCLQAWNNSITAERILITFNIAEFYWNLSIYSYSGQIQTLRRKAYMRCCPPKWPSGKLHTREIPAWGISRQKIPQPFTKVKYWRKRHNCYAKRTFPNLSRFVNR